MDPPEHRKVRALVSQAFTPRAIALLEPKIRAIVQTLLDQVQARGEMDVVDDLAFPLPIMVIAELLGVPVGDRDDFRVWTAELIGADYALRLSGAKKIADLVPRWRVWRHVLRWRPCLNACPICGVYGMSSLN